MVDALADPVLWHDLECGAYAADLPLWRELAAGAGGPVLDVGAGTGRVALELARTGVPVTALDRDPRLLAALRERAAGLPVETVLADARRFALGRAFALIVVPMQTIQLLGGRSGRAAFLAAAARHLAPDGRLAAALAAGLEPFPAAGDALPLPDLREHDGWILCSQPTRIAAERGGWVIERMREAVSPAGERGLAGDRVRLDRLGAHELEAEARAAGLAPTARRMVPPTAEHVGSEVVILRHA